MIRKVRVLYYIFVLEVVGCCFEVFFLCLFIFLGFFLILERCKVLWVVFELVVIFLRDVVISIFMFKVWRSVLGKFCGSFLGFVKILGLISYLVLFGKIL